MHNLATADDLFENVMYIKYSRLPSIRPDVAEGQAG
jgi:hypothetical protein